MRIVDAHHHLWNLSAVHYPWLAATGVRRFFGDPTPIQRDYELPDFRADHAGADVVASVHIQVGAADPLAETRWLAEQAETHDWPLAIVAAADLTAPDLAAQLDAHEAASAGRLRGIRQIVARHPSEDGPRPGALLRDPAFARGLALLAERGLSFDLQLVPSLLTPAAQLFATVPGLRVALCHAGSPWDASPAGMAAWEDGLARFADLPDTTAKISGLGMLRSDSGGAAVIADALLRRFGAHRTMWGSNCPVDALARPWNALLAEAQAAVPTEAHPAVFGDVARKFYRP